MNERVPGFPFRSVLSFKPLIDFLKEKAKTAGPDDDELLPILLKKVAEVPEFEHPVEDLSLLERHKSLVTSLMSTVFPAAMWDSDPFGGFIPFTVRAIYSSPVMQQLLLDENCRLRGTPRWDDPDFARYLSIRAFAHILKTCYGVRETWMTPYVRTVSHPETGLDRHYRMRPDLRFVEVHRTTGTESLSAEQRLLAMEHLREPEVLAEIMPPENFEFRGLGVMYAYDVTASEVMSAIERDFIERDSLFSWTGFQRLQERLRTLFKNPKLTAKITAIQGDQVLGLTSGCCSQGSYVFSESAYIPLSNFAGSVFHRAVTERRVIRVRDFHAEPTLTPVDEQLVAQGVRSLLVAPLEYQGEVIGALKLESPDAGGIGSGDQVTVGQLLPLFAMAMTRTHEELNNYVERIIKEKCTAVHPSVEWRFRRAALKLIEGRAARGADDLEPIVFRDVYPLYGSSDIRGSSEVRTQAIQADLTEHLTLALNVIRSASAAKTLPVLQDLEHRAQALTDKITRGFNSGDHISSVNFLKTEVEPLFPVLKSFGPEVAGVVQAYESAIDPKIGTVYTRRKEFEQSVAAFNRCMVQYLDREQAEAQRVFPHYFDKHQTDGVSYVIYLGDSMCERGGFNELYVKNLRMWQLMVASGMAWHSERLKKELRVPLESAHLILVRHQPLSVRFRFDEKRFDVDGAYDIGDEIIRSRLDKAVVRPTGERLTQPGKIAIVYTHTDEREEAQRHISFLRNQGFLAGDVESLEIEDLPGVHGMKALRVTVDLDSPALAERVEKMSA
ncbi:MAG: GAF domain-containing protein [Desulfomonile sp.]|nr:GAF domain-containing protein [Desulfomonile sp.]